MARARIQKVMAAAGIASRRGGEDLVRAGRVTVDGRLAIIGELVDPEMQRVEVDGNPLPASVGPRSYWALNKPAGVVSTVRDRHADRTVMELLPPEASRGTRLYPVGRLDEESEGLLLFTDDGAWADLMLHPRCRGLTSRPRSAFSRAIPSSSKSSATLASPRNCLPRSARAAFPPGVRLCICLNPSLWPKKTSFAWWGTTSRLAASPTRA